MRKSFLRLFIVSACVLVAPVLEGTGFYGQARWLEHGGQASDMSPEFYWAEELQRMAAPYRPPEKMVKKTVRLNGPKVYETIEFALRKTMESVDVQEFDEALRTGRIVTGDKTRAKALHENARRFVNQATPEDEDVPLPEEIDSEFADYHVGALLFAQHRFEEARAAWQKLLKRPVQERHYRTVWAVFMQGKAAHKQNDNAGAIGFFKETRRLAREKVFADSLGLAAESYGWEARAEWKSGHLERAAELYLTQLAMGDESAVVSLKALVPDHPLVGGLASFRETDEADETVMSELEEAARSPLLRRLVTAHVLATETQIGFWSYDAEAEKVEGEPVSVRSLRWLGVVEKVAPTELDDADHLGWLAYKTGRYGDAERWLKLAKADSPTGLWLRAKLMRREGKLKEAAAIMATVFRKVIQEKVVKRYVFDSEPAPLGVGPWGDQYGYTRRQSAAGDLASLHLTGGEFVSAMDVFLKGDLWGDAAFVGDRILSVDELRKYVETQPSKHEKLRWLLGRKLVRAGILEAAGEYFPEPWRGSLERYRGLLAEGAEQKRPARDRASAFFQAAWMARHVGMELMGTEFEPDGFTSKGVYLPGEIDLHRTKELKSGLEPEAFEPLQLFVAASEEEKSRIQNTAPIPDKRFHYRYVAGELAWKAALLLPDGSDELADVLNCAGHWIRSDESKTPDRFYIAIERRCPKTALGKRVLARRWFVEPGGCWSDALKKVHPAH